MIYNLTIYNLFTILLSGGEESAGGEDILSTTGPNGGKHPVDREIVAQRLHTSLVAGGEVDTWDLVETYEVDPALQTLQQSDDLAGMSGAVVESAEADILKRAATLMGEVVLTQQVDGLGDAHLALCGHQHLTLFGQGRVHRDGHMTFALVEESLELVLDAHAAHGDAFRTPSPTVVGGKDLRSAEHVVEIVHRLTLTHEDDIRQLVAFGQSVDLIQDIGCGEVALKTLLARLTEEAVHLTAHLTGDTQRGAVAIRDKDGLYKLARPHRKEVFDGAVFRALTVDRGHSADLIKRFQLLAVDL